MMVWELNDNQIRLDMKSDKYFNAGVMVINLKEWRANIQISKILLLMEKLREKFYGGIKIFLMY